jgi:N-ethylmaleimide reductase
MKVNVMKNAGLLNPYMLGHLELSNRIVMAPMTRSRASDAIPNDLMADYYGQRAAAGLIVTEGTSPSPNGLGYARIPGIFSEAQVEGWKKTTTAVHSKGGKIFVQLMHTGRIGHRANMPAGSMILAPSAVKPEGQMWTDSMGLQDYQVPKPMVIGEIRQTLLEFTAAAVHAIEAGFDGVEIHGANGYLVEQFLSPSSNRRTDQYGGSVENRCRFLLEVVRNTVEAIGKERIGIRLSPYGTASDMPPYPEIDTTYKFLAERLSHTGIVYVHIVDHNSMGAPVVPKEIKEAIRERFEGSIVLSGGYSMKRAETELQGGLADLIAFGRPFINNPDLVERFLHGWALSDNLDMSSFYTPGEKGYTDYPAHAVQVHEPV